jgi:hypothetical protein
LHQFFRLARRFERPVLVARRQTKAVLMRDERAAKPFSEVARDLRALDLKKTHALRTRNQNRKSAHAT